MRRLGPYIRSYRRVLSGQHGLSSARVCYWAICYILTCRFQIGVLKPMCVATK
ncbi:hypothetical protein BDV93DRAFT_607499 [Ceratobasidium sp. AG-I]|nr:hypothetical protein BDV93DRAFT_607499 [Ceratobasidium sp. AG-I]